MTKINHYCPHCGSDRLFTDAVASWDFNRQKWALSDVHDCTTCAVCGYEADGLSYLSSVMPKCGKWIIQVDTSDEWATASGEKLSRVFDSHDDATAALDDFLTDHESVKRQYEREHYRIYPLTPSEEIDADIQAVDQEKPLNLYMIAHDYQGNNLDLFVWDASPEEAIQKWFQWIDENFDVDKGQIEKPDYIYAVPSKTPEVAKVMEWLVDVNLAKQDETT